MIVWGEDDKVVPWVARQLGVDGFGPATGVGFFVGGEIVGGVVYHNWQPQYKAIEASIATTSPRWATKQAVRFILWVPFANIGAQRLSAAIRHKNKPAQKFLRRLGFEYEGKGRLAFGDDDALVFSMLEEEWRASRWFVELGEANGQKGQQRATGS